MEREGNGLAHNIAVAGGSIDDAIKITAEEGTIVIRLTMVMFFPAQKQQKVFREETQIFLFREDCIPFLHDI